MRRRVRLAARAKREIGGILRSTLKDFGSAALDRYRLLFEAALRDLGDDAERPGVVSGPLADGARLYHLRHSKGHAFGEPVGRPRHLIAFKVDGDTVRVMRVLHDAMDLPARLTDDA